MEYLTGNKNKLDKLGGKENIWNSGVEEIKLTNWTRIEWFLGHLTKI
jgi:hypothetical protein